MEFEYKADMDAYVATNAQYPCEVTIMEYHKGFNAFVILSAHEAPVSQDFDTFKEAVKYAETMVPFTASLKVK